jgi:uncharacterized cysteine cluster protein YcgN (CxxCxxCC family)
MTSERHGERQANIAEADDGNAEALCHGCGRPKDAMRR